MSIDVHSYIDTHQDDVLHDFIALLRIASISALPAHDADTQRAAEMVAAMLGTAGLQHVEIIATAGQPLVYADWLDAPGKPTVLIYAHFDVQPVDPEDEWYSPPFTPTITGDDLVARGATDDKNQVIATIHAVSSLLAARGTLPVNIRFVFEGEEESGGEAIEAFVREHPERLTSDIVLVADGGMGDEGHPIVFYGCRGILYTEIVAQGPVRDVHSGTFGGNAPNPIFALAQIITGLKDDGGHITIPGLYELAQPITNEERTLWAPQQAPFRKTLLSEMDLTDLTGEAGFTDLERAWSRPTLEVHGIIGGFIGDGTKTVIPATARAEVSLRLVPGQTPDNVLPLLEARVAALTPPGIKTEVVFLNGGMPLLTDYNNAAFTATRDTLTAVFGTATWISRAGGSVPIAATFQEVLGGTVMILGFGLTTDRAHSPDEHTSLATFYRSVHAFADVLDALGQTTV